MSPQPVEPSVSAMSTADSHTIGTAQSGPLLCTSDSAALVRDMLERVADKWTMFVIESLAAGPQRFTAIQHAVRGVSHRMLTRTLRALERDGMVTRTAYAEVPPRVEYELTPLGRTLVEPVVAFVAWAEQHGGQVEANRRRFDDASRPSSRGLGG